MSDDLIVHGERWRRDPAHPRLWSYVLRDDDGEDVLVDVEPGEMPLLDEIEELRRWKAEHTKIAGWVVLIYEHGHPTVNWDSTVHPNREVAEAEARFAGRQGWAADVAALQVSDPYGDEHEKRRVHWRDLGVPEDPDEGSRP